MSGRFVSAGTAEDPPERDDEWVKAQQELEANSLRKKEEGSGVQEGGKSLYEVLQANKVAKQEAFEESIRLKNQFRSLDEDEVDFLDSVLESTRAKDEAVRKETTEQLNAFRRQQEEAEKTAQSEQPDEPDLEEQWKTNLRKRKKGKDADSKKGLKLRRTSSTAPTTDSSPGHDVVPATGHVKSTSQDSQRDKEEGYGDHGDHGASTPKAVADQATTTEAKTTPGNREQHPTSPNPGISLGLDDYSSDDE